MFLPDKAAAFAEMARVLRPGGLLCFNAWDRIEHNELAAVVTEALARRFPERPPGFLARTPHGYHDVERIRADIAAGGFTASPRIETTDRRSRAADARLAATAFCQGTPLRAEIEAFGPQALEAATDAAAAAAAIEAAFGAGPIDARIRAHVVEVGRPA
jgi:SAM-dependent methyltransferase